MAKKISLLPKAHKAKLKIEVKKTIILVISLIAITFFVFLWLVLSGYSQSRQNELENIKDKISILETETKDLEDIKAQAQVIETKISALKFLFENHIYWSEFFEELEKLTLKKVFYDNLTANSSTDKVVLSGIAENYGELAKLIFSLASFPKIEKVDLNSAKWESKEKIAGVRFNLSVILKEDILIK